ncbi:hypothetical protein EN818_31965, partial [Mesorhizobium sp. M3A.F.Ca.ET.175.01.1.1]|uniref:3'-5' exonuclease n=1 Tax=Mesorhizobium sp. M3A.F.Ca.ET.175.01.1.1 TaxID=2563945 RepID=UPI0010935F77
LVCPPDPMPAFSAGTMLTRLDTFRGIGELNETFAVGEFMDWYGRARDAGAEIVMLERNYRSTETILAAANKVIGEASERFTKNLWTERRSSHKPQLVS